MLDNRKRNRYPMKLAVILTAVFILGGVMGFSIGWFQNSRSTPESIEPTSAKPSPSKPESGQVSAEGTVNFDLIISSVTGSGLTRTATARVTNTGSADAHNSWGKIEVFSGDSRINLGGNDFLRVDIGVIEAGATVTREVELRFSFFDGISLMRDGARVMLTIYSDEYTGTFRYDYKP